MATDKTEARTREIIKRHFIKQLPTAEFRFINFHGSKYMESGLGDFMVLIYDGLGEIKDMRFWFEIKRNWRDWSKQSRLQEWNIRTNRKFGFYTAWAVGDEVKEEWDGEVIKLKDFISKCYENERIKNDWRYD